MANVISDTGEEYLLSDAHCRSLADRIVAALAEGGGFAACTSVPQACLRRLVELLGERAASAFQVIVISRAPGAARNNPPRAAVASAATAGALPPMFVIDDADRPSAAELRDICEAAPFSRDWAAVLSVRAALITRRDLAELDFLKPRITASLHFRDLGHEEIQPFMFRQRQAVVEQAATADREAPASPAEPAVTGTPPAVRRGNVAAPGFGRAGPATSDVAGARGGRRGSDDRPPARRSGSGTSAAAPRPSAICVPRLPGRCRSRDRLLPDAQGRRRSVTAAAAAFPDRQLTGRFPQSPVDAAPLLSICREKPNAVVFRLASTRLRVYVVAVFSNFVKFTLPDRADHSNRDNHGQSRCSVGAAIAAGDDSGFSSRLELPIAWEALDEPPSAQQHDAAEQSNAGVFAVLLHGVDLDAAPRKADEALAEALAPLRAKLDLIVDMLARLSYRDMALPPRCDIELGERRIVWQASDPPSAGSWLQIKLYFHSTFREPVVLFGRVTDGVPGGPSGEFRIGAELVGLSPRIVGDLARVALLVQRRQWNRRAGENARRGEW